MLYLPLTALMEGYLVAFEYPLLKPYLALLIVICIQ